MRKIAIFLFTLTLLFSWGIPWDARGEIIDRIVASVNGDIITLRELETRLDPFLKARNVTDPREIKEAQDTLLEILIQRILVMQEGERLGFKVSDEEVNAFIQDGMKQRGMSRAELDRELRSKGGDIESFKSEIRAEMMKKKIIRWELALFIVVTDEEIDQYVASGGFAAASQQSTGPKVALRAIVFNLPENPTDADIQKKEKQARDIIQQINAGLDFATAAAKYSEASSAQQGGDIGEMSLGETSMEVREAVELLKEGQVSQPIHIGKTISIFQVVKFVEAGKTPKESTSADASPGSVSVEERERIRDTLMNKKLEKRYDSWLKEVRSRALIKVDI